MTETQTKDIVQKILAGYVANLDGVKFDFIPLEEHLVLNLKAADFDMGRIIGRQGTHFVALRDLLELASRKTGRRVLLGRCEAHAWPDEKKTCEWATDLSDAKLKSYVRLLAESGFEHPLETVGIERRDNQNIIITAVVSVSEIATRVKAMREILMNLLGAVGRECRPKPIMIYAQVKATGAAQESQPPDVHNTGRYFTPA